MRETLHPSSECNLILLYFCKGLKVFKVIKVLSVDISSRVFAFVLFTFQFFLLANIYLDDKMQAIMFTLLILVHTLFHTIYR